MATASERRRAKAAKRSVQNQPPAPRQPKVGATAEQRAALKQARVVLERQLTEAATKYKPQIETLQEMLKAERAAAWREFDERVSMIRSAVLLEPAG